MKNIDHAQNARVIIRNAEWLERRLARQRGQSLSVVRPQELGKRNEVVFFTEINGTLSEPAGRRRNWPRLESEEER